MVNLKDNLFKENEINLTESQKKKIVNVPNQSNSKMIIHSQIYLTAFESFKDKKFLGNGYKSFRYKCSNFTEENKKFICSTHPHNYH